MRRIFVSYAREDAPLVRQLVARLREHGLRVVWDDDLRAGQEYRQALHAELERAEQVIVVWSRFSVVSTWVQQEADLAQKHGKMLPLRLDAVDPPLPFGAIQNADFIGWDGAGDAECFVRLLRELFPSNDSTPPVVPPVIQPPPPRGHHKALALGGFAAIGLVALALYGYFVSPPVHEPKPVASVSTPPTAAAATPVVSVVIQQVIGGPAVLAQTTSSAPVHPSPPSSEKPAPTPPRLNCCHSSGSKVSCSKPTCRECDAADCPK
ncbi:MAG TPA: toll/interleukin-1 receptor domain-containing protein [Polyangiaceae bacterium]|nr:toll/interleukin-1 receptor domain-containing protein [Polyangiaceae bacterium]